MEIKIGSVACMREELAGRITGLPENNKFLITALTDYSVTFRSLADNKTHSMRADSFAENIKWWETLKQPDIETSTKIKKNNIAPEATTPAQEVPAPTPIQPDQDELAPEQDEVFVVRYTSKGIIRIKRISAGSSFEHAAVYEDPYSDDPYGGIYG